MGRLPSLPAHARQFGLTLIELMLALVALGIVMAIALPSYTSYINRSRSRKVEFELIGLATRIQTHASDRNGELPASLAEIGGAPLDPWGNPYQYLRLGGGTPPGQARKDRNLVPINTDFDLYSMGPDGLSVAPLTAAHSRDDIVRGRDGRFIGPASEF
jgi:general secretion pathway protein G